MPKRQAEVQGTKENGFEEMSANPNDMPKRATAAQLANRKIKATRQRTPGRAPSSNLSSSAHQPANPFNTINTNVLPTTTATNGFTFGQSQSFPAADSSPGLASQNAPTSVSFGDQNNKPFSLFGNQTSSAPSSFNFSSSPSSGAAVNNPFSSMPSGNNQPSGGGFQGFKGSMFNIPGSEKPIDQPKDANNTMTNGPIFGASQQTSQAPLFGASSAAAPNTSGLTTAGSIFGQSSSANPFQQSSSAANPFGATSQAADSMQTSPDGKADAQKKPNLFGFSGISQPSFGSAAPAASSTPSFSFTSSSSQAPAATSTPASQPSQAHLFSFGGFNKPDGAKQETSSAPSTSGTESPAKPAFQPPTSGTSLFGNVSKPAAETQPAATATSAPPASTGPSLFGNTSFASPSTSGTLFGNLNKSAESAAASTSESPSTSIFSKSPAPSAPSFFSSAPPSNSLFGRSSKPEESSPAASAPGTTSESTSTKAPLFSAPSTSNPPGTGSVLFGQPAKAPETKPADSTEKPSTEEPTTASSLFKSSSSNIFQSPKFPPSPAKDDQFKGENAQPATSIFQSKSPEPSAGTTPAQPTPSIFQTKSPEPGAGGAQKPLFGSLFPSTTTTSPQKDSAPSKPEAPATSAPASPPKLFSSLAQPPKPAAEETAKSKDAEQKSKDTALVPAESPAKPTDTAGAPPAPKSRISSYGPPTMPNNLSNEERAMFDAQWRVHALNETFQRKMAELDPETGDFESLIEFYVFVRKSIGMPTCLEFAPEQGTKRKSRDEEDASDAEYSRKRAKATTSSAHGKQGQQADKSEAPAAKATSSSISSGKRKADDLDEDDSHGKRAKAAREGVSDTVAMFASSFVSNRDGGASSTNEAEQSDEQTPTDSKADTSAETSDDQQDSTSPDANETNTESPASTGETGTRSGSATPTTGNAGGRSLFDRVEFDTSGKPRRDVAEEPDANTTSTSEKPTDPLTALLSNSKFASSFNSGVSTPLFNFTGSDVKSSQAQSPVNGETPSSSGASPKPASPAQDTDSPAKAASIFAASASASGTPVPETAKPLFGASTTAQGTDNAAKAPSIFATSGSASGSPAPETAKPLFGASTTAQGTDSPAKPPSIFATSASESPAPETSKPLFGASSIFPPTSAPGSASMFKPGGLGVPNGSSQTSIFSTPSSSVDVSRATTPGVSDTGDEGEGNENLPQVDFTRGGAGEEEEEVMFETRARGSKMQSSGWETQGVGLLRILKHKSTGRSRVLLRADPSGKVIINASLIPAIGYKASGKSVQFLVPKESEKPDQWAVQVKKPDVATELSGIMEKCKQA